MEIIDNPSRNLWKSLCSRPSDNNPAVEERVGRILERVRVDGDKALRELSLEIDGIEPGNLLVSREEILEAEALVPESLKSAIRLAASNIEKFHRAQMPSEISVETAPGVRCIQRPVPISRVGLYIPGGTAPLFSTVLMLAIPARVAGCSEVVLCTPCSRDGKPAPAVLYAASFCGVDKIYKAGGAQAIAAMAYGTETIPQVDKIFGPGNQYVTCAKQMLANRNVAIDMPAGPSEVMVLADSTANPSFVAADLLSQAEHGNDSQVVLVCDNASFAKDVVAEVEAMSESLGRVSFVRKSLEKSRFVVFDERDDIVGFANCYAPEHLIVSMRNPWETVDRINAAGSVFVGNYTPESAGDYASGTNHTLPTSSWARSCSGVNIDSYMRKMTIQEISSEGLQGLAPVIMEMAEAEGLQAHANAVGVRLSALSSSQDGTSVEDDAADIDDVLDIETLVRPNVLNLCPYSTARDEYQGSVGVFLDANESPYPTGYNRYPDPHQKALKTRISEIKGIPIGNIFLGNGSDEAIDLVFRVFCNPGKDNVVAVEPSYGMYGVAAATNDIEIKPFRLGEDFSLDPDALLNACDSDTKAIFICSPNNPSGNAFPTSILLDVIRRFRGIVVVDEAYVDFSGEPSLIPYIEKMPNLIVLQTMSKARGMAGLRVGMAFASTRIIGLMSMIKYPYNISKLVQEAALKALEKPVDKEVTQIVEERGRLVSALGNFACVRKIHPSDANFLLVEFDDADRMYEHLLRDGIIVRNRNNVPGCSGCLRITVGLPEENDRLISSILSY